MNYNVEKRYEPFIIIYFLVKLSFANWFFQNNSSGKRKTVIISDDEDNVEEIKKNIKILMSPCDQEDEEEDEGEWLSKAKAPKPPKKKQKEVKIINIFTKIG